MKIIKVDKCKNCPLTQIHWRGGENNEDVMECIPTGNYVPINADYIPAWCPLEDEFARSHGRIDEGGKMSLREDILKIIEDNRYYDDIDTDKIADEILELVEPRCAWTISELGYWSEEHATHFDTDLEKYPFCPVCGKRVRIKS